MDISKIQDTYKLASRFVMQGQLKNAFDKTKEQVDALSRGFYTDKYNDLLQNYQFMLKYFIDGVQDPQQKAVYRKIETRLFVLNCELREELLTIHSTHYEYSQKRYFQNQKLPSAAVLCAEIQNIHEKMNLLRAEIDEIWELTKDLETPLETNPVETQTAELVELQKLYEAMLPKLFAIYWLKSSLTAEERDVFKQILTAENAGQLEKGVLVAALTLNLWRCFGEDKLLLLFDICQSKDLFVHIRAFTGLCFVLFRYNKFLPLFATIRNRLTILADNNDFVNLLQTIILQIIESTETEKVTRKMQQEILPEIHKIARKIQNNPQDIEKMMGLDDYEDEKSELMNFIEENGEISEKIQELGELQQAGADVYMSTFHFYKMFPFFNEISNWFLPFSAELSTLAPLGQIIDESVLEAFTRSSMMCNSDKYSFALSVIETPEKDRDKMLQTFKAGVSQVDEMEKEDTLLKPELISLSIAKHYVQDLYRFFLLFPARGDFPNMFSAALLMHKTVFFDYLAQNSDIEKTVANYYFAKHLYPQAIEIYEKLWANKETVFDAQMFQKLGFSCQKTAALPKAIEAYKKADLLQPDDLWTLQKLAFCYRQTQDFEHAAEIYNHINYLNPHKQTTLLNIARCYVELKKNNEAQDIYNELEETDDNNPKLWRTIVWFAFTAGNLAQAAYYSSRCIDENPIAIDFLYAGHIAWCKRELQEAIQYYTQFYKMQEKTIALVAESIIADREKLLANGIAADEIPLMIDYLQFTGN